MEFLSSSPNVLIFEDDIDLVYQWSRFLKKKGFTVQYAMSIEEANAHCSKIQFDIVILDIHITDSAGDLTLRGGFSLLNQMRKSELFNLPKWTTNVPVLVVTGNDELMGFDPMYSAKHLGGEKITDTLRKPFTSEQLHLNITRVLNKHQVRSTV